LDEGIYRITFGKWQGKSDASGGQVEAPGNLVANAQRVPS